MFRVSLLVCLLSLAQAVDAQIVSGSVEDPAGAPVHGATVVASPLGGGAPVAAVTDEGGRFELRLPAAGRVAIVVSHAGFAEYRIEGDVTTDLPMVVEIVLRLASFAEDLRVSADLAEIPSASSRLGLSRRETPASVDVVTQELIQARGADTASTALRYVTGLTSSLRPGASAVFSSRGFTENSIGILFNGVRVQSSTVTMRNYDAFNFDRVELLRGPASVLHGEGAAAGAINFVRREAVPGPARVDALVETGDAHRFRAGAAVAGSAGASSSYSVSFARNQFDTHVDDNTHAYNHLAGGLRSTIGRAAIGVEGDWLANSVDDAYWGTPLVDNRIDEGWYGRNFNRSDNNRYDDTVGWGRATAAVPLASGAVYNGQVYGYWADRDWRNSYGFQYQPAAGQVLRRAVENLAYDHRMWGTRHDVGVDFSLGGRRGRVVGGVDLSWTDFSSPRSYGPASAVDALTAPVVAFVAPDRRDDRRADLRQAAVFGEAKLGLADRLSVVLGGRAGKIANDVARPASGVALRQDFSPRDGRAGVVFDLSPSVSLYGQYASGSEPIEALLILGPAESGFTLAHTRQWEGGVKVQALSGLIDATVAGYHIRKRNLTTADPLDPTRTLQVGRQSSRGVELAATVQPHAAWIVEANLALLDARYDLFNEGGISRDGNLPPNVPEAVFNLGATWRPAARLEAGVWLSHVGRRAADTTNTVFQPAYYAGGSLRPVGACSPRRPDDPGPERR